MTFKLLAKQYLEAFSKTEQSAQENLNDLLAEDCYLRDWDVGKTGRKEIIDFVQELYDKVLSIDLDILRLHQDGNTVVVEFAILIKSAEEEFPRFIVTDILDFTNEGKIKAIRAFKGPTTRDWNR